MKPKAIRIVPQRSSPSTPSGPTRRITLVFPPMTMPTSPPLGMAMLKGYIEREIPQWKVTTLDLNVRCFRYLLEGIERGAIGLDAAMYEKMGASPQLLIQAARAFSGQDDEAFFRNPELYDRLGATFLNFTEIFCQILHAECLAWEERGEISPLLEMLVEQIVESQPEYVGISMIFSQQLPLGAMLGRYMRQQHGLKVFMGGSCLTDGAEAFMKWYPEAADVIVTGDGEIALKTLLAQEGDPAGVAGAHYVRDGQLVQEAAVFEKNIDAFGAPSFESVRFEDYYSPRPVSALLLSRGCYWRKCTFCVHYFSAGDTYRLHGLEGVIAALRGMVAQGVRHFSFVDEMIAPGHFVRLARAIREADLDIAYYALSKPNKTFTPEILREMAASGCKYILWGLESGNQRILDLMGKGTQVDEVQSVLRASHDAGIANHVYVICGFPTETQEEFSDTLAFLDRNKAYISAIHRSVFSLEMGSPISKDLSKFSIEEVWLRHETPLGGRLGYRCSSGMDMDEAASQFQAALPFFKRFNPYAQYLANFRDHALLVYSEHGERLTKDNLRRFRLQESMPEVSLYGMDGA